ncbi:MAG: hypothetical protein EKK29_20935 [Hyphomicrobiales bacterium]|nr:MAG: hypothetical protein EKK29_20935 [Hyphomicrobiales bacterium]
MTVDVAPEASAKDRAGPAPMAPGTEPGRRLSGWLVAGALVAFGGLAAVLVIAPRAAAGGWLLAFVLCGSPVIGSVFALLIHALTGGRWLSAFADIFVATAATTPFLGLLFIPVLVFLPHFYPWVEGANPPPDDVRSLYLNAPFFIIRSVVALSFWSVLGIFLPRLSGGRKMLIAAVGLAAHAFVIGLIGVDWILSLQPEFWSSSFGATLAFTQFAAALAWVAIVSPGERDTGARADIGGLLLATLLGLSYLNFIALLVIWYGNLPDRVFWFVFRERWPWTLVADLAFVLGAVIPIFMLFLQRVRSGRRELRFVGVVTLAGVALYYAYLIAPPFGVLSLGAGLLAAVAIFCLLGALTFALRGPRRVQVERGTK